MSIGSNRVVSESARKVRTQFAATQSRALEEAPGEADENLGKFGITVFFPRLPGPWPPRTLGYCRSVLPEKILLC